MLLATLLLSSHLDHIDQRSKPVLLLSYRIVGQSLLAQVGLLASRVFLCFLSHLVTDVDRREVGLVLIRLLARSVFLPLLRA